MSQAFSAVLLVGGKSSRMGRDKAFLEIDGQTLWQRQLETLRQLAPAELFLAGPARAEWANHGATVLTDVQPDAGPLAGLLAALRRCRTARLVALAVDLPQMTSSYLQRLLAASPPLQGVVPRRNDRYETLAAVYPVAARALVEEHLSKQRFALQDLVQDCLADDLLIAHPVPPSDDSLFLNLNRPHDLAALSPTPVIP